MALNRLVDVLNQLNDVHLHLLELGEAKKQALISNQVDELIQIMKKESRCVKEIEQLEEQRTSSLYEVLHERGIKSKLNLTITELSRLVFDQEEKQQLLQMQATLGDTLQQVKRMNDLNQQLIEQAMSFINFSVESMSYYAEADVTYQHPGEKHTGSNRSGLFDTRA